jgi:hypothetical protein
MRDIPMENGVWDLVDGTEELITALWTGTASSEYLKDTRGSRGRRKKAVSTMRLAHENGIAVRYVDPKYAHPKALWEQLEADHKKTVLYDHEYLESELFAVQLSVSELRTVRKYVNHIDDPLAKLQLCGRSIPNGRFGPVLALDRTGSHDP